MEKLEKKRRCTTRNNQQQESIGEEDRLSSLPDDLIHHILSFSDMKLAVQTSVLSKRWKLLWTSLPFLTINDFKVAENFLSHRNHAYGILKFRMCVFHDQPWCLCRKFVDYAISHNVQHLEVGFPFGFFPISFEVSELENVNIKLCHGSGYRTIKLSGTSILTKNVKKYFGRITDMFRGLCKTRILTLDFGTIEALSSILEVLVHSPPPFYHLKYVKVPQGYKESSMSPYLKLYLLGNSPKATIVTTLPQETMIPRTAAASVRAQNVVIEEPLEAPTKVFIDSENSNEIVCVDTVDMGVQEEQVVQNSKVHDDRIIRCVGAPVKEIVNDRVSSSGKISDIGLWHGHEVKSEFVCILDHIMNKYPETFKHFATKNKELCTMKLNMLCTTVNNFTKIPMTEVDSEIITEYMDLFDGLKKFGFNISWLVSRLNYIEHLRFSQPLLSELHAIDCHIDDAKISLEDLQFRIVDTKTKLQNLQTLRAEKMQEIQKVFGTMGTSLAVGYIGDDLLPGP